MMYVRASYPSCFENMFAGSTNASNNELFGYESTLVFQSGDDRTGGLAHFASSCLCAGRANANVNGNVNANTVRYAGQRRHSRVKPTIATNSRKRRLGCGYFNGRCRQDPYTNANPHQH